jgi:GDP-4-dehydro-6-deoxy-D-mannose reductase
VEPGGSVERVAGQILVTGAQGFVGGHLLAQLGARGLAIDVDVTDAKAVGRAVAASAPAAVVHLAAVSSVGASWEDAGETWRVNTVGTVNVLEAVRLESPLTRVLVASTGEVYGSADEVPTPEDVPVAPVSPYAASKAAAEVACELARRAGVNVVITRAFQHEGPGRDERFAIGSWANQIARAEEAGGGTVRVGALSARRDITDVRDVCRAYTLLLDPSVAARTYNVATGRAVEMREVLEMLMELAAVPIEVEPDPERMRPADLAVVVGDPSRLQAATGWTPRIPLEQTLADTLEAARQEATERMAST